MLHSILAVTSFGLRGSRDNFRVPGVLLDQLQGSLGVSDVSSTRTSTTITGISHLLAFFGKVSNAKILAVHFFLTIPTLRQVTLDRLRESHLRSAYTDI